MKHAIVRLAHTSFVMPAQPNGELNKAAPRIGPGDAIGAGAPCAAVRPCSTKSRAGSPLSPMEGDYENRSRIMRHPSCRHRVNASAGFNRIQRRSCRAGIACLSDQTLLREPRAARRARPGMRGLVGMPGAPVVRWLLYDSGRRRTMTKRSLLDPRRVQRTEARMSA